MYRKERPLADLIPPDRRRLRAAALVIGGMIAGAALLAFVQHTTESKPSPPIVPAPRSGASNVELFSVGLGNADLTSPRSGPISPDGELDQAFDLVVDGEVASITIVSVDSSGREFGTNRWGTAYDRPRWQLAVFEGGRPLSRPDGTLTPLGPGKHRLRVYASDNGSFEPGSYFRAYVSKPGGQTMTSEPLAFTGHGPAHARMAPFDRGAAASSLGAVSYRACELHQGVDGPGHVTVMFTNDGSVSSVEVDQGGNMKTPRGTCIADAFRAAKVPPFAGAPVRVGKSFATGASARGSSE